MPLRARKAMVAISPVEGTPGTDKFTADSDTSQSAVDDHGVILYDLEVQPLGEAESFQRKPMGPGLSILSPVPGKRHATFSFMIPAYGAASAGTAPLYQNAMLGAGFSETVVPATSVTYTPDAPNNTVTLWVFHDGLKYEMPGATMTWRCELRNGQPAQFFFEGIAKYVQPQDVAMPTYNNSDIVPPPWLGVSGASLFGVGAGTLFFHEVDIDLGITTLMRQDVSDGTGYISGLITDKEATGRINPELPLNATRNFWNDWETPTQGTLDTGTWGSVAGNQIQITCPQTSLAEAPQISEEDSLSRLDIPLAFAASDQAADDEVSVVFT